MGWALVWLLLVLLVQALAGASQQPYERRLRDMRSSIVQALGLAGIPDVAKANVSQSEYERAHQEYLSRLRQRSPDAQPHRSLLTLRPSEGASSSLSPAFDLGAHLSADNCSLESTTLRLLMQHSEPQLQPELELRVYGEQANGSRLLSRGLVRELAPGRARWLQLELPDRASAGGGGRIGLRLRLLRATGGEARGARLLDAALNLHVACSAARAASGPRAKRRALRGSVDELWAARNGRRSDCKASGPAGKKCCRHRMTVNFQDLEGFDFIVQPKSFDAGFCKGRCPPRYNPAHHHALLQSLIWKADRSKAPRPCCAPSKLAELEILYFDENEPTKLKVSNWKDMRVLECACS